MGEQADERISELEKLTKGYEDTICSLKTESKSFLEETEKKLHCMIEEKKSVSADLNETVATVEKLKNKLKNCEETMNSQERLIDSERKSYNSLESKFVHLEKQLFKTKKENKKREERMEAMESVI